MALYKYAEFFDESDDPAFDTPYPPGSKAPYSGIYKCEGCGDEIMAKEGRRLPSQNHHQHSNRFTPIKWRLILIRVQEE